VDNRLSVANLHTLVRGTVRRIWGPPGCGKTTTLARATLATVRERGPESTMIVSFTTTAAAAIADAVNEAALRSGTGIAIPGRNIGTLHSLGFRAIGTPDVALDPKKITGWNDTCPADWRIRPDGRRSTPDMAAETGMLGGAEALEDVRSGDALLGQMELLRATLTPEEDWPVRVRSSRSGGTTGSATPGWPTSGT
jgi:DNA helicase II / ATP-dependent DNA helicase PcrA